MKQNEQFSGMFLEEAKELLARMEQLLLASEHTNFSFNEYEEIFRIIHTLKGSAGMFDFQAITEFAHEVESYLTKYRGKDIEYPAKIIEILLKTHDYLGILLLEGTSAHLDSDMIIFLERLTTGNDDTSTGPTLHELELLSYYISFAPNPDIFRRGINVIALFSELRDIGEVILIPDFSRIPSLSELDPESCLVSWEIFLTTSATMNTIRDVFIFVEDCSGLRIESLENKVDSCDDIHKRLGDILVSRGKVDADIVEEVQKSSKKIGEVLVEKNIVKQHDVNAALTEQKILTEIVAKKRNDGDKGTIRVHADKLDQMLDLVGELVTIEARLRETSRRHENDGDISLVTEQYSRILDELRGTAMRMRMIPVGSSFVSLKRMVRDLSIELEKKVDFVTEGEETEVDKKVIESLSDPLMHILRNCVDHGIENAETRVARGKNETGTIKLSAQHVGSHIIITIQDDGNGLNIAQIRAKAIERGIILPNDKLSDQDIQRLILASGFSTKDTVSKVSGRGVGMDVVAKEMIKIGGSIDIMSENEHFTRFTLKIPLTLAIIDGLQVVIGAEQYVIPLIHVESCIEATSGSAGDCLITLDGSMVSCIDLHQKFASMISRPEREHVVFVRYEDRVAGLLVDRVCGGTQAVVKPLGSLYKMANGISGATICGDGTIALILDVACILREGGN